ncbi:polyketide cyclase [Herbaspirillum sp. HC18]|nr:polyketide cyclase [Herbaspirillum sp. HC18]
MAMKQEYEKGYEKSSSRAAWMIGGVSLGALAMYLSDPDRGLRRRTLASDKIRSAVSKTGNAFDVASRDLGNRLQGLRAQAGRLLSRRKDQADDSVLVERVRQKVGRTVSHPRAVKIDSQQGMITLRGPILAHEHQELLDTVRGVHGVTGVEDRLEIYQRPEGISSLQGGRKPRVSPAQDNWPPAARALALMGGGALGIYGVMRRNPASMALAAAGAALMARSISNMPLARMAGVAGSRRPIAVKKTIHIAAAPEQVFNTWSRYENFPHFMSHVQAVRDLGDGRSHWVVKGPAGALVEWESQVTESRPGELLAWSSIPNSTVQTSGRVHFEPDGDGTRVTVHMSYTPPAGVMGHAAASLFAADPKQQMDEDLMRMKAFIETGRAPHDAARPLQQTTQGTAQQPGATLH